MQKSIHFTYLGAGGAFGAPGGGGGGGGGGILSK